MSKYSIKEINILNSNPNVVVVKYGRQIEYTEGFKEWAVLQSINHPELSANDIFILGGFDINIIGKNLAEARIREWKRKHLSNIKVNMKDENLILEYVKQNNILLQYVLSRMDKILSLR